MGFGFILTIVLLGALLGLFARQALANTEEPTADVAVPAEDAESTTPHVHAM